jgi:hypothetical protein
MNRLQTAYTNAPTEQYYQILSGDVQTGRLGNQK